MEEKRWYAVHTYSGYENKVKANLEKRIHEHGRVYLPHYGSNRRC